MKKILSKRVLLIIASVFGLMVVVGQLSSILQSVSIKLPQNFYSEKHLENEAVVCAVGYFIDNEEVLEEEPLFGWPVVQSTGVLPIDIVPECVGEVKLVSNLATALNLGLLALVAVSGVFAINTQRKAKK